MPPRRRLYDEESEEEDEEIVSEGQSEPMEDELEMDVDEDQDQNDVDDIDVVGDGEHDDEAVVDDEDVVEEDIEDELADDISDEPEAEVVAAPRLKIKLKLPQHTGPSSVATRSSAHNTPSRSSRRHMPRGSDIESEDEDEDEEDDEGSTRSTSVATTAAGSRALTARQAVLANVVDPSHVSLSEPPNPRKKKPLTEIEIALKREETARKRRNLTEKKLEDEKAETINRLLKKQSRARGRRNALSTAEDRPAPGENAPGEGEDEDVVVESPAPPPTMYRWISRAQPVQTSGAGGDGQIAMEKTVVFSFSVPVAALPPTQDGEASTKVDSSRATLAKSPESTPPRCDVEGCTSLRKYRLVRDFQKGACGISHLKVLETQTV
ncbi:hypothetical protein BD414DRAFT_576240 [Trametes punicea]|nr:hypothetical protein BD414DRAFT_576240 [Trametes punicea]